jgi:hypothetical protein
LPDFHFPFLVRPLFAYRSVSAPKAIDPKADYMHNNPVEAGFVLEPYRWKHRRAIDFSSGKGILDTDFLKNYSGIMN